MSLVEHDGDIFVEYEIPKEIEERIPDYFYIALAGELFSVFGYSSGLYMFTDSAKLCNGVSHDYDSGTGGWYTAFLMTCKKLDMLWLLKYYNKLPCYDSDKFDGIMEENIEKYFIKGSDGNWNCYYGYITDVEKEIHASDV